MFNNFWLLVRRDRQRIAHSRKDLIQRILGDVLFDESFCFGHLVKIPERHSNSKGMRLATATRWVALEDTYGRAPDSLWPIFAQPQIFFSKGQYSTGATSACPPPNIR